MFGPVRCAVILDVIGYNVPLIQCIQFCRPGKYVMMKFYCIVKTNSVFLVTGLDFSFLKIMLNNLSIFNSLFHEIEIICGFMSFVCLIN